MKIHTEPYCETCFDFEANSWAELKTDSNNDIIGVEHHIECKHKDACKRMWIHLTKQIPPFIEKEKGNSEKT